MIMNTKLLWFSSSSAIMFLVLFFNQDPSFLLSVQSSNGRFSKGTTLLKTLLNGWTVGFTPMLLQEDYENSIGGNGVQVFYSIDSIENSIEFYSPLFTTKVEMEKFPNIKVWFEIIEIYWNITNSSLLYKLLTVNPTIKKTQLRMSFSY